MDAAVARRTHPMSVHVIGHSGGAILIGELLRRMRADAPDLARAIATIDLFAPACTVEFFRENLLPQARKMKVGAFSVTNLNPAAEASPDPDTYPYGKSLLHLVSNAFEEERQKPIAGMHDFWKDLILPHRPNIVYRLAGTPEGPAEDVAAHGAFDNSPAMMNKTLSRILGRGIDARNDGFTALDLASSEF